MNNSFYAQSRKRVIKSGLKFSHSQHNGDVFTHLDSDNILHRKVIGLNGTVRTYKSRKATEREKQLYAFT